MQRHISWQNASTYTDGTPIGGDAVRMKVRVWKDGVEVYTTLPGVTEWPIEVTPGETSSWELQSDLDEQVSAKSPAISHTEPFQVPMPPANLSVS